MGNFVRLIVAAIMVVSVVRYADAQSMAYRFAGHSYRERPEVNIYLSARYDHLLQVSPHFRHHHMWKECHTINIQPLHLDCIASFDQYEPVLPEFWRRRY